MDLSRDGHASGSRARNSINDHLITINFHYRIAGIIRFPLASTDGIMPRLIRIPLSAAELENARRGTSGGAHGPRRPGSRGDVSLNEAKRRRGDDEIARPFEFSIGRDEIMRLTPCKIGPL